MKKEFLCKKELYKKKNEYMNGKMIEPLKLDGNENVRDFIDNVFGNSGYNARRLAEACRLFSRMIEDNATICLTFAGAMTPIGMSGPVIKMIELGFIDFIISTGANVYHDLHRAYNRPMVQGEVDVDDGELYKHGISRIYDVFIEDDETMLPTDKCILNAVEAANFKEPVSTAELHHVIGEEVLKTTPYNHKSILAVAAKLNVPIYTSSPGDSSVGMNLALPYLFGHKIFIDPVLDVIETTSIVRNSEKNGVVICGGGSPKNFYLQTQPTLSQIFWDDSKGGHDYFIQLTADSPQWGGLSGATPQEARSWGKVKGGEKDGVVVYSCASITLPLLFQYARMSCKPRKRKELYAKRGELVKELLDGVLSNKKLSEKIKKLTLSENYKKVYEKILGQQDG